MTAETGASSTYHAVLTGRIVLLALEDAFVSRYVESVLLRAGAEVVGLASDNEPIAMQRHGYPVSACVVGSRHAAAICSRITLCGELQPALILVDAERPETGPRHCETLASPFAAHQIVATISHLLAQSDAGAKAERPISEVTAERV